MLNKIRVLVVDDSTVIRRLLTDALSGDPSIEVAGVAANGKIALAKMPQLNPDAITLDMEMPEMDGITTLVELRKLYPKVPVVMFSTLTSRGASATLDALAKGANDYVTKPANVGSVTAAIQTVRDELCPKIKALCGRTGQVPAAPLTPRTQPARPTVGRIDFTNIHHVKKPRIDAVAIGSSTGGPNALQSILPLLPASLSVPVLVVQHMPPIFTKHLADRLNQLSPLRVIEASEGEAVEAGSVYIAPGDFHMTLRRDGTALRVALDRGTPENSCRPAVDVLFRSVAEMYGPGSLAVVLTGMGQDGARGCRAIREAGGRSLVQDESTSVVWGMPGATVAAGEADAVLPLQAIAPEIVREVSLHRNTMGCRS